MKKYDRIFTFGCSFTNYHWATWADIIAYSYPEARYYNMGLSGAGNELIYNRVIEADARYNFTKNDLVIVQWSSILRESRWVHKTKASDRGGWTHGGNILTDQSNFGKEYTEKYVTVNGFYLRDLALIKAVNVLLDFKQPEHYNIAMQPLVYEGSNSGEMLLPENYQITSNMTIILLQMYNKTLKEIRPSFYQHILAAKKSQRPKVVRPHTVNQINGANVNYDWHPTPYEHYIYLRDILPEVALAPDCDEVAQAEDKYVYDRFTIPQNILSTGGFNIFNKATLGTCTDMNFVKEYYNVQVKFGSFNPSKLGLLTFNRPEVIY